ncbi:MAG: glycosyltransferase [Planctomycetota bacterium]|nr:glycosyltransferase [Planctomycetota bacterium]
MKPVKDILKHSSVYAVGQILSRFASVLLLPLYTRCLSPADYGCVAILDLTAGILAILIGSGMASAVMRSHFDSEDEDARSRVWWTGLTWVVLSATALVVPLVIGRHAIAELTLGTDITNGAMFYVLAAGTLWMNTVSELLETWLRVKKRSGTFVVLSMGRLLLNIGLNVWFLVGLDLGVAGLLTGNVIAATVNTIILLVLFARSQSRFAFDKAVLRTLLCFGSPLIIQAFLSLMMHEADRYLLRAYASLDDVGVYSLAYKVGQAVNTLCMIPFGAIWGVVMYEIAQQPDAKNTYAQVFKYYVYGLLVVMLAAALFAFPVLPVLTPGDFSQAVDLIPIIVLAFVFFAMHSQFCVPVLLARRTAALIPASIAGVAANVVCNMLLIPRFGAQGAAWASVATYATFSFTGLWFYRKVDRYPYPFARCLLAAFAVGGTYVGVRFFVFPEVVGLAFRLAIATLVTGLWTVVLFGPVALPLLQVLEEKTGFRFIPSALRPNSSTTKPPVVAGTETPIMKTLLLSEIFPPQNGGSGRWFYEIYSRLPREKVVVVAGEHPLQSKFDSTHGMHLYRLALMMPQWGLRSFSALQDYWRLFRAVKRVVRHENVTQLHCGRCLPEGWLAFLIKKLCRVPYVCYVHGEDVESAATSRELSWMVQKVLTNADYLIANSQNTARLLTQNWVLPESHVRVLHPGVDTSRFVPAPRSEAVRRELSWNDRTVVLTVGRLQERKGHDVMIEALSTIREAIPNVLFAIVGNGEQREQLQQLAVSHGVVDHVQFLGEVDDATMIRCYQQCDLFALPNRQVGRDIEGFGMVLVEAQACGRPVLAGASGGTRETMNIGRTGVVVPCENADGLAAEVTRLLLDRDSLEDMGKAARPWVVRHLDWNALSKQAAEQFEIELPASKAVASQPVTTQAPANEETVQV